MIHVHFCEFAITILNNARQRCVILVEVGFKQWQLLLALEETSYSLSQVFQRLLTLRIVNLLPKLFLECRIG